MRTKLFNAIKISALALVLSFGLSFVYAWTAPTSQPPAGNVSAPINTSATAQTKAGNLTISATTTSSYFADFANPVYFVQPSDTSNFWNTLTAGTTTTNGLTVMNGAGTAGQVLTSDANGNASWQAPTGGGGGAFGPGYVWSYVTANRAVDVVYTNTTGYPIEVSVSGASYTANYGLISATVGGVAMRLGTSFFHSAMPVPISGGTFIVPNNTSYSVNVSGGSLDNWVELRCDSGVNCSNGAGAVGMLSGTVAGLCTSPAKSMSSPVTFTYPVTGCSVRWTDGSSISYKATSCATGWSFRSNLAGFVGTCDGNDNTPGGFGCCVKQ